MNQMRSATSTRRGFTLFEVLMALALSAMLLVAVMAALDLSIRMSVATPRSLQSAERSAALLRILTTDLRQSEDPENLSAKEPPTRWSRRQANEGEWDGIMGGETWIAGRLGVTSVPPSSQKTEDRSGTETDAGRIWFVYAGGHSARAPFPTAGAPHWLTNIRSNALAKEELRRYVAREGGSDDLSSSETLRRNLSCEVLATDIFCRFRYFDGKAWHSEWSSRTHRSIPHAVEITLLPTGVHSADGLDAGKPSRDSWKRVVSLSDRTSPKEAQPRAARSGEEESPR